MGARLGGVSIVALIGVLALGRDVRADIYLYRDRFGVLHFTNAATERPSRLVLREASVGSGPRILTPSRHGDAWFRPTPYDALIREIADRHGVEYALVKAVIRAESGFNPMAVSSKGALGLMQLMPATAVEHQVQDAFHPRENVEAGCRHLRRLIDRYGGNVSLALAAYNAGPGRVEEAGGVPPFDETRTYLARVLRYRLAYLREATSVGSQSRR
jgi:soluble lytic murein transglycosylase-like protein